MSRKFTDEEVVEATLCCTAKSCDTCPFIVLGEGFEKCIIKFSEYIANNTKKRACTYRRRAGGQAWNMGEYKHT